jgi:hypothetical protein
MPSQFHYPPAWQYRSHLRSSQISSIVKSIQSGRRMAGTTEITVSVCSTTNTIWIRVHLCWLDQGSPNFPTCVPHMIMLYKSRAIELRY